MLQSDGFQHFALGVTAGAMAGMLPTLSKEAIHRETSACGLRNGISTFMCDVKIATHVHRDNRDMHLCLKGVVHSLSPT